MEQAAAVVKRSRRLRRVHGDVALWRVNSVKDVLLRHCHGPRPDYLCRLFRRAALEHDVVNRCPAGGLELALAGVVAGPDETALRDCNGGAEEEQEIELFFPSARDAEQVAGVLRPDEE